jgi:hypothetical protein
MIKFALAEPQQIGAAFKFAGLDENPRYQHMESSIEMARALKAEGYVGLKIDDGFVQAVKL